MTTTVRSDRHAEPNAVPLPPSGAPDGHGFWFLRPAVEPGEIGRLGTYRVFRLLGAGGMGKVFLAQDTVLNRDVALKVMCLPPGEDRHSWWERFLREARALAAINHPNLVTVYQAGEDNGTVFLAMELLQGETLEALLRRAGPLDPDEVFRIAEEIATGLAALHDRGLIHRDIKPSNIWLLSSSQDTEPLDADEPEQLESEHIRAKILDFGLVRGVNSDTQLTEAGAVVGTPAYMSIEQVRGGPLDHRTDLFSFGCVLYAMCTGRSPYSASNPVAQAAALVSGKLTPIKQLNSAVATPLARLIEQCLAKEPEDRPNSAAEISRRLRSIRTGRPSRTRVTAGSKRGFLRRPMLKLVAVVVSALVAAAALVVTRDRWLGQNTAGAPPVAPTVAVTEYLSEMPKFDERPFPPPDAPQPPNVDGSVWVNGVRSPHGVFMHGAPGFGPPAFCSYSLDRKYRRFMTEVALNDSANRWSGLIFVVRADGKEVWSSGHLSAGGQKQMCDIDVSGASVLQLEVRTIGPHMGAHGAWLEPRLTK